MVDMGVEYLDQKVRVRERYMPLRVYMGLRGYRKCINGDMGGWGGRRKSRGKIPSYDEDEVRGDPVESAIVPRGVGKWEVARDGRGGGATHLIRIIIEGDKYQS
jgi:hypothetical protein